MKVKTYGKPFVKGGITYVHTEPFWKRWTVSPVSCGLQWLSWRLGFPWHNPARDECTPGGNCCRPILGSRCR